MRKGDPTLEIQHVSAAYDSIYSKKNVNGAELNINPFNSQLEKVLVSEIVMPSRYNPNALNPDDRLIMREFSEPKIWTELLKSDVP